MSNPNYECRWNNCRQEFKEKDLFQAHIISHLDMHEPTLARDLADYRKAQGYSGGSLESQTPFEYLNTETQSQSTRQQLESQPLGTPVAALPSITPRNLSSLGFGHSPPFTPILPSPSFSSKIRSVTSPVRIPVRSENSGDPLDVLASGYLGDLNSTFTPVFPPRQPTPPPTAEEVKFMEEIIRPATPPPNEEAVGTLEPRTPATKAVKRKKSVDGGSGVKFSVEETPANKKRKTVPKTPYPESGDEDDSNSDEEEEERQRIVQQTDELDELAHEEFVPASQAKQMDLGDDEDEDEDADGELEPETQGDPALTQAELESVHSDEWLEAEKQPETGGPKVQ
ncbi:hypothetical protein FS842_006441 [Serendipita sp. 407]|nr:hypothetical protein FS842_006441 [Serendipita sp. 407]